MKRIALIVNGKKQTVEAAPDTPLLWILRDVLNLTGTKYGCGIGACGACAIHQNGRAVRACQITIAEAAGKSFTTIEHLSDNGTHPCQRAASILAGSERGSANKRCAGFQLEFNRNAFSCRSDASPASGTLDSSSPLRVFIGFE